MNGKINDAFQEPENDIHKESIASFAVVFLAEYLLIGFPSENERHFVSEAMSNQIDHDAYKLLEFCVATIRSFKAFKNEPETQLNALRHGEFVTCQVLVDSRRFIVSLTAQEVDSTDDLKSYLLEIISKEACKSCIE